MWFVIDPVTRELLFRREQYFNQDESVLPTDGNLWLKRVVDDTQPPYDPATEKLVRTSTDDDVARTRTFHYEVVALTQEEIDARAQAEADESERQMLKTFWENNLQGDPATASEVRAQLIALKRVVKYLARNEVR